ncbi:hypothetical protein [Peribacillus loiseleuriae]|uniref:hypothetical protein n=1 Tax=Peribacillus loiseleuriae TaxID=1679170 RepID=UPI003D068AF0
MQGHTPYDKLSMDLLVGFYYEINMNIKKGILSEAMYHEIELIKQAANRRGISVTNYFAVYDSNPVTSPKGCVNAIKMLPDDGLLNV